MNIAGITGLTAAQKATLKALAGVELVATDCNTARLKKESRLKPLKYRCL
ncbi:MAG: hypothetical protein V7L26_31310 [Nostoc sp.]